MKITRLISIILIFVLSACATHKAECPGKSGKSGDPFFAIQTDDPEVKKLFRRGVVLT